MSWQCSLVHCPTRLQFHAPNLPALSTWLSGPAAWSPRPRSEAAGVPNPATVCTPDGLGDGVDDAPRGSTSTRGNMETSLDQQRDAIALEGVNRSTPNETTWFAN